MTPSKEGVVGVEKGAAGMNALRQKNVAKMTRHNPFQSSPQFLLFDTSKPTIETLESLHGRASAKDNSILHLWREDRLSKGQEFNKRSGFRHGMLTARGSLAFALPYFRVEDNAKVCALLSGRESFFLQDVGDGNYEFICGDFSIDGLEDGKRVEVAQKLGVKEEEICIV